MNPQLKLILQQAIQAFHSRNFDSADLNLKRVLQIDSKNLPALHISALIKISQANYKEAAVFLRRAAQINPNDASIQYNLAKALSDCGNDNGALIHHKKAVALAPNNPEAWLGYGKTAFNLGRYDDALAWFSNSLSLKPDYAEAWFNKGATLKELKRYDEAIAHYEKALSLKSDYAEGWSNMGITLKELKLYDESIAHHDKALSIKPDYAEGWSNKGATLNELKRYNEAIAHYDKALSLKPEYAEAWFKKGVALKELKRSHEAITHYDKALSLKPDLAEAWANKGAILHELKRYDEAIAHYDKALSLKTDIDWALGDLLHLKMKICSWSSLIESLEEITKKVLQSAKVVNPFPLLALSDDILLLRQASEIYAEVKYPKNLALGPIHKRSAQEKIRVGYFSADFRHHAVSILTAELYELHDRSKFEIIAFSFGVDDKSEMRSRLSKAFDRFFDVSSMSDLEIAKLSRDLKIDIAVDLGGFTTNNRMGIFVYRAAPIQVSYIGYLSTLGTDFIDYLIADKNIVPEELQKFYSEKIAYLPSYQINDRKRTISDRPFTRQELGLPENSFVFCCFNNNYKILPATFDGWLRILKAVEDSVLFLYAESKWAAKNLKKEAEARGINSARLIFGEHIPADEYLARYRTCDLFLDTYPYNAGTTASDALWTGLPVLTLMGKSFASRVAGSLLNAIGLSQLITTNQEEYEALAVELAKSPQKLEIIKHKLANNRLTTPLFDAPLFAKNLEAVYIKMYERYQAGSQPDHISIF